MNALIDRIEETLRDRIRKIHVPFFPQVFDADRVGDYDGKVVQAVEYSLLAGGKRLRPVLLARIGSALGLRWDGLDDLAAALEFVHTASLILDDLPCMDDAELRRGKPACHRAFGEGIALLAADILITDAFGLVCSGGRKLGGSDRQIREAVTAFSDATGSRGLISGQMMDLDAALDNAGYDYVVEMHRLKTGSLFSLAVELPAGFAETPEFVRSALTRFIYHFSIAFQIADDLLDLVGQPEITGKDAGLDERNQRATFVTQVGGKADDFLRESISKARRELDILDGEIDISPLADLLDMSASRTH